MQTTSSARQNYPAGVPHEIDPEQYRSLPQMFDEAFARYADRPFSVCMERWMSYGELDALSKALGAWLQSRGLEPGARVAIMLPNIPQFAVTMCGVLRAGYTCVNVNPLYTARELEHQLKDSGATAIVILENFASTLEKVIERTPVKHVVMTSMGDLLGGLYGAWITMAVRHLAKLVPAYKLPLSDGRSVTPFSQAIAEGRGRTLGPDQSTLDSIAFLQYTGGTTGLSKGAVLTHRNIVAATLQAEAWFTPALSRAGDLAKVNSIAALPLYHIFALTVNGLLFLDLGGTNLLITNPRDIPGFVKELSKFPFTAITGVNTLFNALLNDANFNKLDFSTLRLSAGGGMAVQKAVAERWEKLTGHYLLEGYGLTECSPLVSVNPYDITCHTGSIGLPVPSTDVRIVDDEDKDVAPGEAGELCIRGPQVMTGYWQRADATDEVLKNGWLHTGDIVTVDSEGFIRIVDRKKDMILVSGFNVYPNEIEDVLMQHEKVREAAAIGVPSDLSGEAVKVCIVKKDPSLTKEEVLDHCRRQLTGYKVPKIIEFRDELPKTNVGKILRRELRDEAKREGQ